MLKKAIIAMIMLAVPAQASAETTVCSDPSRAKILNSAVIKLPTGGIDELDKAFEDLSESIGMSTWGVTGSDNDGKGKVTKTVGLQSPKVSVSISAHWKIGEGSVKVVVERTCYNDNLEPWSDYWRKLISGLKAKEFIITQ